MLLVHHHDEALQGANILLLSPASAGLHFLDAHEEHPFRRRGRLRVPLPRTGRRAGKVRREGALRMKTVAEGMGMGMAPSSRALRPARQGKEKPCLQELHPRRERRDGPKRRFPGRRSRETQEDGPKRMPRDVLLSTGSTEMT